MPRGREGDQATDDGSGLDQMTLITSVKRTLISISHATPEANDFTPWLGARLAPRPRHRNRSDSTVQSDWIPRAGRDASRIADEVIAHLVGLVGARVTVTLEIEAEMSDGAPDHVVRTVTENGRTLKFTSQGFEKE